MGEDGDGMMEMEGNEEPEPRVPKKKKFDHLRAARLPDSFAALKVTDSMAGWSGRVDLSKMEVQCSSTTAHVHTIISNSAKASSRAL